ncbi:hypothetical protein CALCODRAFT_484813 [Calocera cornea HHB12733]|uniref:Uncharacterized protein n=1 Tax=Calocera cornea HHB12733 TaxID=1353952 RepID=A0A165ESG4_9BASI|nr:hypothetical protein CALCODRAFT_484813 [Calocera cornea HHB12733]
MAEHVQPGVCAELLQGVDTEVDFVFQILRADHATLGGVPLRTEEYRLVLSDCEWSMQVMLDPRLNHLLVSAGELGLIRVRKVVRAVLNRTRIIVISGAHVVPWDDERQVLGEPVPLNQSTRAAVAGGTVVRSPPTNTMAALSVATNAERRPSGGRGTPIAEQASVSKPPSVISNAARNAPNLPARVGDPVTKVRPAAVNASRRDNAVRNLPAGARTGWGGVADAFDEEGNPIGDEEVNPVPISTLGVHAVQNYLIHVRVVEKGHKRSWNNEKGSGEILTLVVQDQWRTKCKVIAFHPDIIKACETDLVVGSTISMWNCKVTATRGPTVGMHPFDITLGRGSNMGFNMIPDTHVIPFGDPSYTSIDILRSLSGDERVDVIGIIVKVGPLETFKDDKGKEKRRRELAITDETTMSMRVGIWGGRAVTFAGKEGDTISLLGVVVDNYGGGSLNVHVDTTVELNPESEKATKLKKWYDRLPEGTKFQSVSSGYSAGCQLPDNVLPRSIAISMDRLKDSNMGRGTRVDTFNIVEKILRCEYECTYRACTHEGCNKKLDVNNLCYTGSHNPQQRGLHRFCFLLKLRVGRDDSWYDIAAFDGVAERMLGMTANKTARPAYSALKDQAIDALVGQTWWFTVQARTKSWNQGQIRTNSVKKAVRVDDEDGTVLPMEDYERDSDDDDHVIEEEDDIEQYED